MSKLGSPEDEREYMLRQIKTYSDAYAEEKKRNKKLTGLLNKYTNMQHNQYTDELEAKVTELKEEVYHLKQKLRDIRTMTTE